MLSYDFDIYHTDLSRASNSARGITIGSQRRSDAIVAVFRDKQTTDAVTASPPAVRLFLEETGFGFSTPDSIAKSGYVPATDAATRRDLVDQLTQTLSNRALKKALSRAARQSEFDVVAFIASVVSSDDDGQILCSDHTIPQTKITPRRPGELRCKGIKSRMRPH
ncbi:MAG: hypothetical protein AAFQ09_12570 [Pseudomonadota bacterium]